jgi:hypothetical protein
MGSLHGSREQGCDMYHLRSSHVTLKGVRGGHRPVDRAHEQRV